MTQNDLMTSLPWELKDKKKNSVFSPDGWSINRRTEDVTINIDCQGMTRKENKEGTVLSDWNHLNLSMPDTFTPLIMLHINILHTIFELIVFIIILYIIWHIIRYNT